MSVLIKGMEMPENCFNCPFGISVNFGVLCCPTHTTISDDNLFDVDGRELGRQDWCPLVHVPPHGDLIDRDALVADLKRQCKEVFKIDAVSPDDFWITRNEAYNESLWKTWCESFFEYLKTRETIIPAEEGE